MSVYANQAIFDAIGAAVTIRDPITVEIDVAAFLAALAQHHDLKLSRPAIEACFESKDPNNYAQD